MREKQRAETLSWIRINKSTVLQGNIATVEEEKSSRALKVSRADQTKPDPNTVLKGPRKKPLTRISCVWFNIVPVPNDAIPLEILGMRPTGANFEASNIERESLTVAARFFGAVKSVSTG
jgi:hypothetical protein